MSTKEKLIAIAVRAGLTYFDTALGLLAAVPLLDLKVSVIKTIAVSAAAPALSVIRNGLSALGVKYSPSTITKP